jgi:hypothetical protein
MNVQLIANEENHDSAQCGKNQARGMISPICRARKHVGNGTPEDRSDDAEHDRPEDRYVHVHHGLCDNPRDEPNKNVPNQVKHFFLYRLRSKTSSNSALSIVLVPLTPAPNPVPRQS